MPIDIIVKHCSPTLAGIKTANLFSYRYKDRKNLILEVRELNNVIVKKGLRMLIVRLNTEKDFPHEIGLFLGYPPEDVEGFIRNKAQNYLSQGLWKVYGDTKKAEALFARYKSCQIEYYDRLYHGSSLEELIVAG